MTSHPVRLLVIDGRAPTGRSGRAVADWFVSRARRRPGLDVEHVVVAELGLPLYPPASGHPTLHDWAARVRAADAAVIVMPEYNRSFPAGVKLAVDALQDEWEDLPVGFVTYGGISGGLRAADQLRPVLGELRAVVVRDTVSFAYPWERLDDTGVLDPGDGAEVAADVLLADLERWALLLRRGRAADGRAA